jgi:hypothetical protein
MLAAWTGSVCVVEPAPLRPMGSLTLGRDALNGCAFGGVNLDSERSTS